MPLTKSLLSLVGNVYSNASRTYRRYVQSHPNRLLSSAHTIAANVGLAYAPKQAQLMRPWTGIPFRHGDIIVGADKKEASDLICFEEETRVGSKYKVSAGEKLVVRNSVNGLYDERGLFSINESLGQPHYLLEGIIYNSESRKSQKEAIYVPVQYVHKNFELFDL